MFDVQSVEMIGVGLIALGTATYFYFKNKKAKADSVVTPGAKLSALAAAPIEVPTPATPIVATLHPDVVAALVANTMATAANTAAVTASVTPVASSVVTPPAVVAPISPTVISTPLQVDPIVPAGTPNTVTLPETNHTLSLPMIGQGENLIGYCGRVSLQAGGDEANKGGLVIMQQSGPSHTGNPLIDWPILVDWFYNRTSYMTPAEQADAARAAHVAATSN